MLASPWHACKQLALPPAAAEGTNLAGVHAGSLWGPIKGSPGKQVGCLWCITLAWHRC